MKRHRADAGRSDARRVVLDTNVFVGAGFNTASDSAWIVETIRNGSLQLAWTTSTRAETEHILRKIPPLDWHRFADLFRPEGRYDGPLDAESFTEIEDVDDRKFAALAVAFNAVLITTDEHLLSVRDRIDVEILKPAEYRSGVESGRD